MGILVKGHNVAWFATFAYLVAFILFFCKAHRQASWFASAGALVALDTFRLGYWYGQVSDTPIDSIDIGFYLWELSLVWLAAGSFVVWRSSRRTVLGKTD